MSDLVNRFTEQEDARRILQIVCRMLKRHRRVATRFEVGRPELELDCFVLIQDAARWFCAAVSKRQGESAACRWSNALPQSLFEHPEVCEEILTRLEAADFHRVRS